MADGADNTALGDLLGITEAALDTADPVSLARGYSGAMRRAAFRPWRTVPAVAKYGVGLGLTGAHLVTRALGHPLPEVVHPEPARRAASATPRGPTTSCTTAASTSYLLTARLLQELVGAARARGQRGVEGRVRRQHPRRRAVAHQLRARQPARAEARVRDRRHEHRARPAQLRARHGAATTAGRARSTVRRSSSGRTPRPRPGASCSATS